MKLSIQKMGHIEALLINDKVDIEIDHQKKTISGTIINAGGWFNLTQQEYEFYKQELIRKDIKTIHDDGYQFIYEDDTE